MKYEVIKSFMDLEDNKHIYHVGDVYPRAGYTPAKDRVNCLLSGKNNINSQFIKAKAIEK